MFSFILIDRIHVRYFNTSIDFGSQNARSHLVFAFRLNKQRGSYLHALLVEFSVAFYDNRESIVAPLFPSNVAPPKQNVYTVHVNTSR